MAHELLRVDTISFDGTFYTCPKQFTQLWTIFGKFGIHTFPAIHCLLTCKKEELYRAVLLKIRERFPILSPKFAMSDWEKAARNAIKTCFDNITLRGCMFLFNQRIIDHIKTHKLGRLYKNNADFRQFIRAILALPLLPAEEIEPTYNQLNLLPLHVSPAQTLRIDVLKMYLMRNWIRKTSPNELSVYMSEVTTNNGAESYHKKNKAYIKTPHPRIWSFIDSLNKIIVDYDTDLERLHNGIEITRVQSKIKMSLKEGTSVEKGWYQVSFLLYSTCML